MTIRKATGMPACKGDIDSQAAAWLIELEDEPFGPELLEQFRSWLARSPRNRLAYREIKRSWLILPALMRRARTAYKFQDCPAPSSSATRSGSRQRCAPSRAVIARPTLLAARRVPFPIVIVAAAATTAVLRLCGIA